MSIVNRRNNKSGLNGESLPDGWRFSDDDGDLLLQFKTGDDNWETSLNVSDRDLSLEGSLLTSPSSIYLGRAFRISNGILTTSYVLSNGSNALGLKVEYDENGTKAPSFHKLSPREDFEISSDSSNVLDSPVTFNYTTTGNNLIYDFFIIPAETGELRAQFYIGSVSDDNLAFDESRNVVSGELTRFEVGNKFLLTQGLNLTIVFTGVNVMGSVDGDPYLVAEIQPFVEQKLKTTNNTIYANSDVDSPIDGSMLVIDTRDNAVEVDLNHEEINEIEIVDMFNNFDINQCVINLNNSQGRVMAASSGDHLRLWYERGMSESDNGWWLYNIKSGEKLRIPEGD